MYPTRLAGSQLNLFISGVAAHTWRRRERGVHRVRVLIANQPRLMRELVLATIADQPDIEVIGVTEDQSQLIELVDHCHPDFAIITLDRSEKRPDLCDLLLYKFPDLKVLALASEQN